MPKLAILLAAFYFARVLPCAAEEQVNQWVRQEKAIIGPDRPVAVVWSPTIKWFMSLGWVSNAYDRRAPYTCDELAFDLESGQWENWYPGGKKLGATVRHLQAARLEGEGTA